MWIMSFLEYCWSKINKAAVCCCDGGSDLNGSINLELVIMKILHTEKLQIFHRIKLWNSMGIKL